MGNRALRKKVASRLKELKIPYRLYKGKGNKYQYYAGYLRGILNILSFKVGDIIYDCDGNNHIIAKMPDFGGDYFSRCGVGYIFGIDDQFEFTDGRLSCGCGCVERGVPRRYLEQRLIGFYENNEEWLDEYYDKIYAIVKAGGHIHDEQGVLLKEFQR